MTASLVSRSPRPDRALTRAVTRALAEGRVALAYQPVVDARRTDSAAFHEGLLRITDPDGGVVPAGRFMAAVEASPLGRRLDCRALDIGLAELAAVPDLRLSINASPLSVEHPDWLATLNRGLAVGPCIAERLIVELTETAQIANPARLARAIARLQDKGLAFALDDFGAGATAFRHLRDFRFDILKIDGLFTRQVDARPDNRALMRALVDLARHFEALVVAERVESAAEAEALVGFGVDGLQGYFFGAPVLDPPWRAAPERRIA